MTAATVPAFIPARELPDGADGLFHSDWGLLDYQADDIAEGLLRLEEGADGGLICVWDMGLGKTIYALCTAALLYEMGAIDQVFLACEQNKVRDWVRDAERFTALSALRYHDAGRQKRLARHGVPHILVTTHETGKLDLMRRTRTPGKAGRGTRGDGPLFETLGLRGKRVLWIFDEPKFRNRGSELYQAYEYVFKQLRRGGCHQRFIALTGTPYETSPEDAFNLGRLAVPQKWPGTIKEWENLVTGMRGRDDYHQLMFSKTMLREHFYPVFQSICLRKRKTDADVIDQFPKKIERAHFVAMGTDQRRFYATIEKLFDPPEGEEDPRDEDQIVIDEAKLSIPLMLTAGHPAAHLHAKNEVSQRIVEEVGEEGLRAIGSAKVDDLITRMRPLIKGQGAQAIIFSRFTSVCVEVVRELRAAGFVVGEYHGRVHEKVREKAKADFENRKIEILFASDMAARGLDFPDVQYACEYDAAVTYALHGQRIDRIHRISATIPSVTCDTYVLEGTREERIFKRMLERNREQDDLLGDTEDGSGFISAATRRELLAGYRARRPEPAQRR